MATNGSKLVLTLPATGEPRGDVERRVLALARTLPAPGCIVNLLHEPVPDAGLPTAGAPPLDAVVELWLDAGADAHGAVAAWGGGSSGVAGYVVDEVVQRRHERPSGGEGRSAGVKGLYFVNRRRGLDAAGFARHWHEVHGPLALKIHVGMSGYVQNVVRERLGAADADVDGIAALHFPSVGDLIGGMYDSMESARVIAADVERFVGGSRGYVTEEHVVRAPELLSDERP